MSSTNSLRNYKHDITGKFKDISTALHSMDESSFTDPDNNQVFFAVHEVLLKMIKTSRNTMKENLKQDMILVVSDKSPNLDFQKLQIQGVTVRYEIHNDQASVYFFLSENTGNLIFHLGSVHAVLPITSTKCDLDSGDLKETIGSLFE